MKVFFSLDANFQALELTAVAIGNFDGLHLGHQEILRILVEEAAAANLNSLVFTFSPHPEKILGQESIRMIQTLEQRLEGLKKLGVKTVLVMPFSDHFSQLTAREFIEAVLWSRLRARLVVVGQDFRFGRRREGNADLLSQTGRKLGLKVLTVPPVIRDGQTVSSSLIRDLLEKGEVDLAARYLGRVYEIDGTVIKGDSRGQSLGIPTANISSQNEILPPGVFITETKVQGVSFPSVTNIGQRPTFGPSPPIIESHIIDFNGNLYGEKVRTGLYRKIRDEKKFLGEAELKRQVNLDIEKAKEFWARKKENNFIAD
ncbi:MAG: bifunctional riboflavin kinase/FAD synthetase [Candidatus Aminicenantales bacterium]